jgi:cyclophilin family peptidyl-prolyl cis-trans isomerase
VRRHVLPRAGSAPSQWTLLTDKAPVAVAVFAQLSEAGEYDGLTFHRIVPNFVIQGGSPGADEYDGRSRDFMRDEPGFARNAGGTIGISTRARDTGDAQIYFNLVDNFRLYSRLHSARDDPRRPLCTAHLKGHTSTNGWRRPLAR